MEMNFGFFACLSEAYLHMSEERPKDSNLFNYQLCIVHSVIKEILDFA